jgi:hypothetical protein
MMKLMLAFMLAAPAVVAVPGVPRSGLPRQMDSDAKITAALRRASGLSVRPKPHHFSAQLMHELSCACTLQEVASGPPAKYVTQDQDHFDNTNENSETRRPPRQKRSKASSESVL